MSFLLNNLGVALGLASALAGVVGWGIGHVRRNYGFERDINHLKRDCKSLSDNMNIITQELERRMDLVEKESAIVREINQLLIAQTRHNTSDKRG